MAPMAQTELMPDFSGRVLNGRVRLLEGLGAGAYGKVYRAMDCTSSRPKFFAVKCLNKPKPGSYTDLLQQREFALHKLVSGHPNIVTFYRYFADDRFVYVVLDLCTGGDLFAAITERHLFQNNECLLKTSFLQLIDAVQHCHDMGVFHRDIKPENILCSHDGTDIRLADFGLSIQSPVCQDFGCGSSYYMSPECIGREFTTGPYSTRHNDVWALGVILTNMITGRNPWRYATTEDDCFWEYLRNNDFLLRVLPISEEVNIILKKIFTVNPLHRISLPSLRAAIVGLDTFFFDDSKRISLRVTRVRSSKVNARNAHVLQPTSAHSVNTLVHLPPSNSESSDERYILASPMVDHISHFKASLPASFPDVVQSRNTDNFVIGNATNLLSVPSSASSGSSNPESKGPITPATYAFEPSIEVSDIPGIPEEQGLGDPVVLAESTFIKKSKPANVKSRMSKAHFFWSALQRLRGLSNASA